MSVVLRCWSTPLARDSGEDSLGFLKAFDFEYSAAPGVYPTGFAEFTPVVNDAMRFPSVSEAFDFWRQRSKTVPNRPDGKPNRPLTAVSVEIIKVEEEERA